ncbi:MAG: transglycosylase SLT domain-containing protein [Clostridia bacterium]|nr:transglycosylase SLT domain-containing protein [Clostridia bacterium]
MKYKRALLRSAVIAAIIILSVVMGFLWQAISRNMDLKNYPREFSEFIEKYSLEYGVPEKVIYSVIKYESDFQSNHVGSDTGVGLTGLKPEDFTRLLSVTNEDLTDGILYDPETNVRYGTMYLSTLYSSFGRWEQVFAAVASSREAVEIWRADPDLLDEMGKLTIPDASVAAEVKKLEEISDKYKTLYNLT